MLGWAEPPKYDNVGKVLYFANNIHFHSETGSTLNYKVQFLGRKGFIQMNLVSDINKLELVKKDFPELLGSIQFKE